LQELYLYRCRSFKIKLTRCDIEQFIGWGRFDESIGRFWHKAGGYQDGTGRVGIAPE
jgi:hypothetical protein